MNARATLLLLADGRFPAGGHAYSAGIERSVAGGRVDDLESLASFLDGRLHTTGYVDAAIAAAVVTRAQRGSVPWEALDHEVSARIPSRALRDVSRSAGRRLIRVAGRVWVSSLCEDARSSPGAIHQSSAIGVAAASAGLHPVDAAIVASYLSITTPAGAAVRLLGLDPVEVQVVLARLMADVQSVAHHAEIAGRGRLAALPAVAAPASELTAEEHAATSVRLFVS